MYVEFHVLPISYFLLESVQYVLVFNKGLSCSSMVRSVENRAEVWFVFVRLFGESNGNRMVDISHDRSELFRACVTALPV